MKTILFTGLAATALLSVASAAGASDSWSISSTASASDAMGLVANGRKGSGGMHNPGMGIPKPGMPPMAHGPRPGMHGIPKTDVYRRPFRGYVMPRYWVQPSFYIPNYTIYGLSAPSRGYNWSRYYDDAVLTDQRGYVQDYRSGVNWNAGNSGEAAYYDRPDYGPSMRTDSQAYDWGDKGNVSFAAPDGSSYSYNGEWQGEYVDPQGQVFEGAWEGTVTRHGGVAGPGYPAPPRTSAPNPGMPYGLGDERGYSDYGLGDEREYSSQSQGYNVPRGYEGYERCLKGNGLTGAAIGAILGGVAGNRIAGRGDRLGGTLLGAGLGGLVGVGIEKATSRCKRYEPRYQEHARPYPQQGYPQSYPQGYQQQSQGWQGGYYYYPQAPMVSVTVVPGASHTTTTVTEEVYYETVRTAPRHKAVRKWKPKPNPHCVCR